MCLRHAQLAIGVRIVQRKRSMNSPPGFGPQRPPFSSPRRSFRQVAPAPPPIPSQLNALRGMSHMAMSTPPCQPQHQTRQPQPFLQAPAHPPFMPSMPFMPFVMPMIVPMPPHAFPLPYTMPLHDRGVQHIHHHHYHHPHQRDPHTPGFERAFPSKAARQRHEAWTSPRVYGPDGDRLDGWNGDGGPEVVDLEDMEATTGEMMICRRSETPYKTMIPAGGQGMVDAPLQPEVDIARTGQYSSGEQPLHDAQPSEAEGGVAEAEDSLWGAGQMSMVRLAPRHDVSGLSTESGSEIAKSASTRTSARPCNDARQLAQHVVDVPDHAAADREKSLQSTQSLGDNRTSHFEVHTPEPRRTRSLQYVSTRLCFAPH